MIMIKKGVVFHCLKKEILDLINLLDTFTNKINKNIWITAARNGKHRKDSYHYLDLALDIRRWNLTSKQIEQMRKYVEDTLGIFYDFVLEKNHIHIEFDKRRYDRFVEDILKN